jgi:hypothetical protein
MRLRLVLLILIGALGLRFAVLQAQEPPIGADPEGVENYAYTHDLGFGGYDAGEQEGEIGITFGSTPLPRFWKFNIPRVLIGYRFAENFRGIRIKFGLPF